LAFHEGWELLEQAQGQGYVSLYNIGSTLNEAQIDFSLPSNKNRHAKDFVSALTT
jgi:hypothetical protein